MKDFPYPRSHHGQWFGERHDKHSGRAEEFAVEVCVPFMAKCHEES
jgi:hypothetical protein